MGTSVLFELKGLGKIEINGQEFDNETILMASEHIRESMPGYNSDDIYYGIWFVSTKAWLLDSNGFAFMTPSYNHAIAQRISQGLEHEDYTVIEVFK